MNKMTSTELKAKAKELKVKNWWTLNKEALILAIEAATPKAEPKKVKAEKPKTEEVENLVTLKDIIPSGIKGTKARRLLRDNHIERPFKRWEWHKEDHKEIIAQIIKLLK